MSTPIVMPALVCIASWADGNVAKLLRFKRWLSRQLGHECECESQRENNVKRFGL